ncbi:hypothetical protein [Runella limosa]|uniref:hypothetical protein n=1 Tax=Runella limosa TaxID=370978 RepID=UPI0012F7A6A5|nr:hypothetical protein [Runella limosa]
MKKEKIPSITTIGKSRYNASCNGFFCWYNNLFFVVLYLAFEVCQSSPSYATILFLQTKFTATKMIFQVQRIKKVASERLNLSRKKGKGHPKAPRG